MVKMKKKSSTVNKAMDKSLASGKEVEQLKIHKQKEEEVLQKVRLMKKDPVLNILGNYTQDF